MVLENVQILFLQGGIAVLGAPYLFVFLFVEWRSQNSSPYSQFWIWIL